MHNVLLVTKGHPFERDPFFSIFDEMEDVDYTHVEQPAAQALFDWEHAQDYAAFVLYDMPGINFAANDGNGPEFAEPSPAFKARLADLLERGQGFVFLHHAIAGWPAWEGYADLIGGRFCYMPTTMRGKAVPDSGYRHAVEHEVSVVADHPITEGVPPQFKITDELYLYEVFEDEVEPLLTSGHDFTASNFYSATSAVRDGKMFSNEGWEHADGSNLVGWCKTQGKSRIVYLQCGDDPVAYANPHFQRLLSNAIKWVSRTPD